MSDMEHNERFEPNREETPTTAVQPWYVDLKKEEYVAYRMLAARLIGPLRQRIPTLIMSLICCGIFSGYGLYEWWKGWVPSPDPVLMVGALVALVPAVIMCGYVPFRLRRDAAKQYDRSVQAGVSYYGELAVYPDCVEKIGQTLTATIRLDERTLFIETAEMMVITAPGSPAIILPARCLTESMARSVRQAMERIPANHRRFIARTHALGEPVVKPEPKEKPEELWVNTFTYNAAEYATVLKGLLQQHFWRMAPLLVLVSMMASFAFGYDGKSLLPCVGFFIVFMGTLVIFNLVLPLSRVKRQAEALSPHDLTVQVRIDTMGLYIKLPHGAENLVLWCDVDHVYEREDFVEVVHNKRSSLYIPKRVIDDLPALDAIIQRCRGKR